MDGLGTASQQGGGIGARSCGAEGGDWRLREPGAAHLRGGGTGEGGRDSLPSGVQDGGGCVPEHVRVCHYWFPALMHPLVS